ncbi:MAG TPA: ATP-binding protein, partial [Pseudoxanthomonas sp.]|nr:ATP-binding protein [Pseudoxanthomonas sp.]
PLPVESGPPLGIDPSDAFPLWHGWLEPGDCLVAYTDGVTEAFNLADEAYGSERLLQALPHGAGAAEACGCVLADVRRFAAGAPPSDDTTVLALSRTRDLDTAVAEGHAVGAKGETSLHISVAQTHEDVARMTDAVDALLARHGASDAAMFDARLIVEEVASNAVAYAVAPGAPLELHARVADGRLWLEFRDRGHAFDPTALQEPDLDADIGLRPVGGLGVHLVRRLAESLDYRREGGWNLLRITLRLHAAQDTESTA